MKHRWLIILSCSLFLSVSAQKLARVEYFIDTDPGYGKAIPVLPSSGEEISFTVPLKEVPMGVHLLYVRAQDVDGKWSHTASHVFLRSGFHSKIVRVEFFVDEDPGLGKAKEIPVEQESSYLDLNPHIDLADCSLGEHVLCMRGMDEYGRWSDLSRKSFWVVESEEPPVDPPQPGVFALKRIEYFFDTDPGYGKATAVSGISDSDEYSFRVSLERLSPGAHVFYLRAQGLNDCWSHTLNRLFLLAAGDPAIIRMEYYFDTDPGTGKGFPVTLPHFENYQEFSFTTDLSFLPEGEHMLYVRGMNEYGFWSPVEQAPFRLTTGGVGVEQVEWLMPVQLYPVPASDVCHLIFDTGLLNEEVKVTIVSVSGKVVSEKKTVLQEKRMDIDVSGYPDGIYLLLLKAGDQEIVKRILVNH